MSDTVDTWWARIYLSGPLDVIEHTCRSFCMERGLCVTVTPTKFIYTGGEETGACVGLVNYPRYPTNATSLDGMAMDLAERLLIGTRQNSVMVMTPNRTTRLTRD